MLVVERRPRCRQVRAEEVAVRVVSGGKPPFPTQSYPHFCDTSPIESSQFKKNQSITKVSRSGRGACARSIPDSSLARPSTSPISRQPNRHECGHLHLIF